MTSQISVLGVVDALHGFDAARFGVGSIERAQIHLLANYTPIVGGERQSSSGWIARCWPLTAVQQRLARHLTVTIPGDAITSKSGCL